MELAPAPLVSNVGSRRDETRATAMAPIGTRRRLIAVEGSFCGFMDDRFFAKGLISLENFVNIWTMMGLGADE